VERVVRSEGVREKRYLEVWSHRVLGYVFFLKALLDPTIRFKNCVC